MSLQAHTHLEEALIKILRSHCILKLSITSQTVTSITKSDDTSYSTGCNPNAGNQLEEKPTPRVPDGGRQPGTEMCNNSRQERIKTRGQVLVQIYYAWLNLQGS